MNETNDVEIPREDEARALYRLLRAAERHIKVGLTVGQSTALMNRDHASMQVWWTARGRVSGAAHGDVPDFIWLAIGLASTADSSIRCRYAEIIERSSGRLDLQAACLLATVLVAARLDEESWSSKEAITSAICTLARDFRLPVGVLRSMTGMTGESVTPSEVDDIAFLGELLAQTPQH